MTESNDTDPSASGTSARVFFRLVVVWPNGSSENFDVAQRPISIGRAEDCVIQIREAKVSRRHCVVFARAGRLHLQDQASANGTFVNGKRVTQAQLRPGDKVRIGSVPIRVEVSSVGGLYGVALNRARPSGVPEPPDDDTQSGSWGASNMTFLNRVCAMMARAVDDASAAEAILDLLLDLTALGRAFVMLESESATEGPLEVVASKSRYGSSPDMSEPCSEVVSKVLADRTPICTFDVDADPALAMIAAEDLEGIGVVLCAPIEYDDAVLGVIYADAPVDSKDLNLEAMSVFKGIAGQAGTVIAWARQVAELRLRNKRLVAEQEKFRAHIISLEGSLLESCKCSEEQRLDLLVHRNELETLLESRESTALGLVQDVRSMVDAVRENIEVLSDVIRTESGATRTLEKIRHLTARMTALTEDMLAVVQMENGAYGLSTSPVEVTELLGAALERNRGAALALGVRLTLGTVDPDLLAIADRNVVGRVLDTLVGNALSAAEQGTEISLSSAEVGGTVTLVISSSTASARDSDSYSTGKRTMRASSISPHQLHGLGMLFCRLAADAHGGNVQFMAGRRSSQWSLELPARRDEEHEDTVTQ